MNEQDWDAEFRKVLAADQDRAKLEAHMREHHGVVAAAGALTGRVELETLTKEQLLAGHEVMHRREIRQ